MLPLLGLETEPLPGDGGQWIFHAHLVIAVAAYSLLGIAAVHACIMVWQGRALHRLGQGPDHSRGLRERLLDQLPPLLAMESSLFRQLWAGFGLLTLTLVSGFIFAQQSMGSPFLWDHKTVFSALSWFSFLVLLAGRLFFGWRGKRALRWCLGSYAVLVLAYFGTQFVFEFVVR